MSNRIPTLLVVMGLFGVLSVLALTDAGYWGIIAPHFLILAALACTWMIADGQARGINAWPFVVATFLTGSFGVLDYLILREVRSNGARRAAA